MPNETSISKKIEGETLLDQIDAIDKINFAAGKEECAKAHFSALPVSLKNALSEQQTEDILAFRGLVLEWLPLRKRQKIEFALKDGLLNGSRINGTNKTFISEKQGWSLITILSKFGIMPSISVIEIQDFFPKK